MVHGFIKDGFGIIRHKHAMYDLKYHLLWILKHKNHIFNKSVTDYWKEMLNHIREKYG